MRINNTIHYEFGVNRLISCILQIKLALDFWFSPHASTGRTDVHYHIIGKSITRLKSMRIVWLCWLCYFISLLYHAKHAALHYRQVYIANYASKLTWCGHTRLWNHNTRTHTHAERITKCIQADVGWWCGADWLFYQFAPNRWLIIKSRCHTHTECSRGGQTLNACGRTFHASKYIIPHSH